MSAGALTEEEGFRGRVCEVERACAAICSLRWLQTFTAGAFACVDDEDVDVASIDACLSSNVEPGASAGGAAVVGDTAGGKDVFFAGSACDADAIVARIF